MKKECLFALQCNGWYCSKISTKIADRHVVKTISDDEAESILKIFREKRDEIAKEINVPVLCGDSKLTTNILYSEIFSQMREWLSWICIFHLKFLTLLSIILFLVCTIFRSATPPTKEVSAEDILIAEGTATLELADKQAEEGMHKEAARNYHTATVYFRVLESMVPRLTSRVHAVSLYIVSIHCSTSSPLIFSNGREFCRPPSHHLYRPLNFHTTSNLLIVNHTHFLSSLHFFTIHSLSLTLCRVWITPHVERSKVHTFLRI